jgi:cytohesin
MRLPPTLPAVLLALACVAGRSSAEEPPLPAAVRSGNRDLVALLLEKDPAQAAGPSLIHLAAVQGHQDVAELLLDRGARIDIFVAAGLGMTGRAEAILKDRPLQVRARTGDGLTPLHLAARNGHTATAEMLLGHGTAVGARDPRDVTPLHLAAAQGQLAVAALLLDRGARVDAADESGRTPLHEAARYGRREVAELLLTRGADVNARRRDGDTPLHDAAAAGQKRMVALLLARGADADAADLDSRTPLHLATLSEDEPPGQETMPEERVDRHGVVEVLLKQGADPDALDVSDRGLDLRRSPLDHALEKGRTDLADLLAARGAALDVCQAIRLGKKDRVAALLPDDDTPAEDRETTYRAALRCAAEVGDVESVRLLVARGADPRDGLEPAAREGNKAVVELLLGKVRSEERAGAIDFALRGAVEHGQRELAECLLGRGGSLDNEPDKDGRTPLHDAACDGNEDLLRLLLERGAQVDAVDRLGMTALHVAANRGIAEAVKVLISHKADVNARDKEGQTPLHWAARYGQKDAVQALLDGHADVSARDNAGRTPLHAAAQVDGPCLCGTALHAAFPAYFPAQPADFVTTAELLIEHKADVDAADNAGATPLDGALGGGWLQEPDVPLVKRLLERGAAADDFVLVGFGPVERLRTPLRRNPRLVGARDKDDRTPLHAAAVRGDPEVVRLLVERGAPVNAADRHGETALHIAAAAGRSEIVKLLLAAGADCKARAGTDHTTPLYEAAVRGHADVVGTLLAHAPLGGSGDEGADLLHEATERGHAGVVQALLAAGVDPNARGWGRAPRSTGPRGGDMRRPSRCCSRTGPTPTPAPRREIRPCTGRR